MRIVLVGKHAAELGVLPQSLKKYVSERIKYTGSQVEGFCIRDFAVRNDDVDHCMEVWWI